MPEPRSGWFVSAGPLIRLFSHAWNERESGGTGGAVEGASASRAGFAVRAPRDVTDAHGAPLVRPLAAPPVDRRRSPSTISSSTASRMDSRSMRGSIPWKRQRSIT